MARVFNPIRSRQNFDEFLLEMELSRTAADFHKLGGAAISRLGEIVEAWLVGLQKEIEPALQQCHAWLKQSIETGASLGDVDIPATRREAFGLSHWMLNNENDAATYLAALDEFEFYFRQGGRKEIDPSSFNKETQRFDEILNGYLENYLAACIQCEQYQRGVSLYEKVGGKTNIDPGRTNKIIEFGYWVCRENLNGTIPTDQYVSLGARILERHLQGDWLPHGQMIGSAMWLKTVYWHSGVTSTPLGTILKAYELMPDVAKPVFVTA